MVSKLRVTQWALRGDWRAFGFCLLSFLIAGCAIPPQASKENSFAISIDNMSYIPGGSFEMGSNKEENEKPVHRVYVDAFYLDKFEVTQGEFELLMGMNNSMFRGNNLPVHRVTWWEADEYCKKVGKRLPTEAEWERAQRGGMETEYYWGEENIDDYAWYHKNSDERVHPVGQKRPNAFGLYDMAGNVYEWVADWYDEEAYKTHASKNPKGPQEGKRKVIRGGNLFYAPVGLRSSNRDSALPQDRYIMAGFRCAKDYEQRTNKVNLSIQDGTVRNVKPVSHPICKSLTPLHRAVDNENLIEIKKLLKQGADVNKLACNRAAPLLIAAQFRDETMVKILIEYGADVNTKSKFGTTPLHLASHIGANEVVNLLLSNKADVNAHDKYGDTALHMASFNRYGKTMELLISYGASVNLVNNKGNSPLHHVSRYDEIHLLGILLKNGAKVNVKNLENKTPLYIAVINDHPKVVDYLIKHGAEKNIKDNQGKSPLDYAKENENPEIIEILKR